jgi:chromosome segregation ATPase
MQRHGVDYHLVAQAAEQLTARGEAPTIDRVRVILGSGSNTTISKYLHQWRNNTVHSYHNEPSTPMAAPDPVQLAVKHVWFKLREETDAEIETIKSETQRLVTEAEQQAAKAVEESMRLTILCEGLQEQVYTLQAQSEIQNLDYKKLESEHGLLQERYQGFMQRYQDLQQVTTKTLEDNAIAHQHEINLLSEKQIHQESLYQKIIEEVKQHAEELRLEYMRESDELKTSYKKISKELEIAHTTISSKEATISEIKTELSALTSERDGLSARLEDRDKHWDIYRENNSLTNNIWTELKDIPKMDFTTNYISRISDVQGNIEELLETVRKMTQEATASFNLMNKNIITKLKTD